VKKRSLKTRYIPSCVCTSSPPFRIEGIFLARQTCLHLAVSHPVCPTPFRLGHHLTQYCRGDVFCFPWGGCMNRLDSHVAFGVPPGRSLRQSTLPLVKGDFADPGQIVTDRCCLRVALLGSVRVREGESGPSLCLGGLRCPSSL
jgi:hypothetical protein